MAISRLQREACQRSRTKRPPEPIATFMETLLLAEAPTTRQAPLINYATNLFAEHWTGATRAEVIVPVHNTINLLVRTCTELQADVRQAEASAAHAAELQVHLATLEEHIPNPLEEGPQALISPTAPSPLLNPSLRPPYIMLLGSQ